MEIATINPATGTTERAFSAHSAAEVERRLAAAHTAAGILRGTSYAQRAAWLRQAAHLMESESEGVARTIVTEMGKTIGQARAEVAKSATSMRFYADHAAAFLADSPLDDPSVVGARRAGTRYEPLGVILAVMPWNYPVWQVMRFAAPALMAGNAGLLKHASNVPQAALYLDSLFSRAGFPAGAFSSLLIGVDTVAAIIEDTRVRAVTLTGSEGAGRAVGAMAGRSLKKAVLELGGSDPFIVLPSADLEQAASTAVLARMNNNGQSCIAGKRFIVHGDVYEEFAEKLTRKVAALKLGDPLDEATEIGPLATADGRDGLARLVDDALQHGASARTGGLRPTHGAGWFYPPTVLEGVTPAARLFTEEAFGPVAVLYRAADDDEAIALANGTPFGLSSSVWTTDVGQEERFTAALEAGAVFVNGMSVSFPELPFGGIKDSGYGRELGWAGIREFCNLKSVWVG
jgi:succinate-semialdehyde dehydrogenase/glutarate-semialdehyde dehydrogenase